MYSKNNVNSQSVWLELLVFIITFMFSAICQLYHIKPPPFHGQVSGNLNTGGGLRSIETICICYNMFNTTVYCSVLDTRNIYLFYS